jgi:hypothetical protein
VDITAINTVDRYEEFADLAITRFKDIVIQCNGSVNGIDLELKKEAERIFYEAAGSGYKRKLMKALATVSLKHIEN